MTQDGQFSAEANPFAAAERISATLGTLTDALFDARTSRHPASSLTALRVSGPAAEALFDLPLAPNGPVHTAVDRLGTVITAGTARPGTGAEVSALATGALLSRYGTAGPVRGASPDAPGVLTAARFELPVTGEPADPKLRPPFTAPLAALAAGQQTRQPVELATGAGSEVRLVVPPGFHALTSPGGPPGVSARTVPLGPAGGSPSVRGVDPAAGAAAAELATHLAETAEELFSGAEPAGRRDFAVIAATLADAVCASGAVYAGVAALRADGRPADATLVVSLARHPLPITGLATELATVRRHAEVWTVLLPAGPAAVLVEGRSVPVPGPLAADGVRRWAVTSVVEAFVPLPDGASVLCVQLSTAQPQDWELYTDVFAELLKSVQFGWDGVPGAPAAPAPAQAVPVPVPSPPAEPAPALHAAAPADAAPADAVPADAAPLPGDLRGTPVRVPPADFNPFAQVADPTPARPILVPDGAPGAGGTVDAGDADLPPRPKGTPVMVPPPDFDPFAPQPDAQPAPPVPAGPPPAVPVTDPFGTVTAADRPQDPFGTTVLLRSAPVPPPPAAPPAPGGAAGNADEPGPRPKGTPVMVPPPDFNPFAPQPEDRPAPPPAAAPEPGPFG
ncbi:hypothetical protein [Streptomyces sp. BE303]|uniref:hypothetical protein n=1 Tax=Streptomyces sp. BE303 TaxID=3002528 RepID=UPI002E7920D7|nr:hypothetical protein [Streptomyces sp. BE303]MED7949414.1 hypothetical protein [Streptomyces sp. BE303]